MPWQDDDEYEADWDQVDEADRPDGMMTCPYCRARIFDESEQCPECGKYLSEEDAPSHKPVWVVVCALVCLGAALAWAFGR